MSKQFEDLPVIPLIVLECFWYEVMGFLSLVLFIVCEVFTMLERDMDVEDRIHAFFFNFLNLKK